MLSRHIALGCALAAALGLLALPPAAARAAGSTQATGTARAAGSTQAAGTARAATARAAVAARKRKTRPALSISTGARTYAYGSRVVLTVTLGRTQANRTVLIYAAPVGLKRWLWNGGKVNSAGRLRRVFELTRTTTFTVVYRGDARDAPAMAILTLRALAGVADGLSGYFRKTEVGRVTYYVFHGGSTMVLHATVTPNKYGECLRPETEQWDAGIGWDDDIAYSCDILDPSSHDSAPFNLARAVGDQYRIRADYRHGAWDLANLDTDGAWLYLVVVR